MFENIGKADLEASENTKTALLNSPTGMSVFDDAMNGGFPTGSVVLVAGSSGSGKTLFSFKWLFEAIEHGESSLYVTLTEPLFNTLKNLETMEFYNKEAVEQEHLKILDFRDILTSPDQCNPQDLIDYIERQVQETGAKRLVIDSITAIAYVLHEKSKVRQFIFELGKMLATLGCTTILTSEVASEGLYSIFGVEEFVSDVILRFDRYITKRGVRRKVHIVKVRGRQTHIGDLHFKINTGGLYFIPPVQTELKAPATTHRVSIGSKDIDGLLDGGVLQFSSTLVAGSTGTGKSLLGLQFLVEGLNQNEPCLLVGFEEGDAQIRRNASSFGWNLKEYEDKGQLFMRCVYPQAFLLEEHLADIKSLIEKHNIKRCVVDSLSAVANAFPPEDFAGFVKQLNGCLKSQGVTSIFILLNASLAGGMSLTDAQVSTSMDNIVMLRHVEMEGKLQEVLNIVKIRGSSHSKELIEYDITDKGIVIGQSLEGFEGILTGVTRKVDQSVEDKLEREFKRFLGRKSSKFFRQAKEQGLHLDPLLVFIDDLVRQGELKEENATFFRENIKDLLSGEAHLSASDAGKIVTEFFEDNEDVQRKRFENFFRKKQ
jgi:circadian clock protein KaiC